MNKFLQWSRSTKAIMVVGLIVVIIMTIPLLIHLNLSWGFMEIPLTPLTLDIAAAWSTGISTIAVIILVSDFKIKSRRIMTKENDASSSVVTGERFLIHFLVLNFALTGSLKLSVFVNSLNFFDFMLGIGNYLLVFVIVGISYLTEVTRPVKI